MIKYKYTLDTEVISRKSLWDGYTNIFRTAYYLRDVTMKNHVKEALKKHNEIELHIVIPKKGVVPGWFITTKNKECISFKGRINYMHDRKVRWACYQYCGELKQRKSSDSNAVDGC